MKRKGKFEKVMHEFKENELHSGSKKGPKVKSKKQAEAIAFSEERRAEHHKNKKKHHGEREEGRSVRGKHHYEPKSKIGRKMSSGM